MVRKLPDGNWLLRVEGIELEGVTADQKRELLKAQIELESARRELILLREQIGTFEALRGLFEAERGAREKEAAALAAQLSIVNQRQVEADALIQQLIKQTKRNKLEGWLNNPIATLAFKLIVPLGTLIGGFAK